MASPTMTVNHAAGNLLASTTVNAGTSTTTFDVDYSAKIEGQIQIAATFGTVATTAGLQVDVFRHIGVTPGIDTQAMTTIVIVATGSTTQRKSVALPTGRYRLQITNLDATNNVTGVTATDDTLDGIS